MSSRLIYTLVCSSMFVVSGCVSNKYASQLVEAHELEKNLSAESVTTSKTDFAYSSVYKDFVAFDFVPDIGWREANDAVGEIGGWRAYARLVQEEAKKEAEQAEMDKGGDQQ